MQAKMLKRWMIHRLVPTEIRADGLAKAVHFLESIEDDRGEGDEERPIFIFSAGWRSGSTLLQRMVCSNNSTLVWGEPFGDFVPIPRLAQTIAQLSPTDLHVQNSVDQYSINELTHEWIANMNPGVAPLRQAHRAYMDNMFAQPAYSRGFTRWGIKCVRLSAYHTHYLRWLYPQAKFIFLVRHPLSAYQSYVSYLKENFPQRKLLFKMLHPVKAYRHHRQTHWYTIRPYFLMDNALKFWAHWTYLAQSFADEYSQLNALLVRYEDLISDQGVVDRLSEFLEMEIATGVLNRKVGKSNDKQSLGRFHRQLCTWLTKETCQKLDYWDKVSAKTMPWLEPVSEEVQFL